jgi:hypothetical protein
VPCALPVFEGLIHRSRPPPLDLALPPSLSLSLSPSLDVPDTNMHAHVRQVPSILHNLLVARYGGGAAGEDRRAKDE